MADYTSLLEESGNEGIWPGDLHANLARLGVRRSWFWPNPNGPNSSTSGFLATDRQSILKSILGTTDYAVNANQPGRLSRTLPLADPEFPWAYASDIVGFRGVGGTGQTQEPPQLNTNDATFPGYTLYPNYELTVECTGRNYPISPDSSITSQRVLWTDIAGAAQNFPYFPEWLRFTDWEEIPQENWLSMQRGTAYFKTLSGNEPAGAQFQGQPRKLLPDSIFHLKWDGVPARYLLSTNSFIKKFRGMINQNGWNGPLGPIPLAGATSFAFPPGSLLYQGYKSTKYNPVYPVTTNVFGSFLDYSKLVDIDLFFLLTQRPGTDLPTPLNAQEVIAGHNLQLYFPTQRFYYTDFKNLAGTTVPLFQSFPIELLFTDPDMPGAYSGTG